jgi:hypothetical protein
MALTVVPKMAKNACRYERNGSGTLVKVNDEPQGQDLLLRVEADGRSPCRCRGEGEGSKQTAPLYIVDL